MHYLWLAITVLISFSLPLSSSYAAVKRATRYAAPAGESKGSTRFAKGKTRTVEYSGAGTSASGWRRAGISRSGGAAVAAEEVLDLAGIIASVSDDAAGGAAVAASASAASVLPKSLQGMAGTLRDGVISLLPREDTENLRQASRYFRDLAAHKRTKREAVLGGAGFDDDTRTAMRFGEVPPSKWVPKERDRITEMANDYLQRHDPEAAYQFLTRNGIPLEGFSRLEDLSPYLLMLEAALETGRAEQALRAINTLMYSKFFDRTNFTHRTGLSKAGHYGQLRLLGARARMAVGSFTEGRRHAKAIISKNDAGSALTHRAKAVLAEAPVPDADQTQFLGWGPELLESPHLSIFQKSHVLYRLGEIQRAQGDIEKAIGYYKRVLTQSHPQDAQYTNSLHRLSELDAVAYREAIEKRARDFPPEEALADLAESRRLHTAGNREQAIFHLNRALQRKTLIGDDRIAAQRELAYLYIESGNSEHLSDAIELLSAALYDQQRFHAQLREYTNRELKEMNLELARALEQQAQYKKLQRYPHRSFDYYKKAEELAETQEEKLRILKERTDHQFQAYLTKDWTSSIHVAGGDEYITVPYKRLLQESTDSRIQAQVYINLGHMRHLASSYVDDASDAYRTALEYYLQANKLRDHLLPGDQAFLDLQMARVFHDSQFGSLNAARFRTRTEEPLVRAIASGTLRGRPLFDAYRYLGDIKRQQRKYQEAYDAYTQALNVNEGRSVSGVFARYPEEATVTERLDIHYKRAKVSESRSRLEDALADYDAILEHPKSTYISGSIDQYYTIYIDRARTRYQLGRFDEALEELNNFEGRRALLQRGNPSNSTLRKLEGARALALMARNAPGDREAALEATNRYLRLTERGAWYYGEEFRGFFEPAIVDQWLLGNVDNTSRFLEEYYRRLQGIIETGVYDLIVAANKVQQGVTRSNLKELKRQLAVDSAAQAQINRRMIERQRRPFWGKVYSILGEAQLKKGKHAKAERSLRTALGYTDAADTERQSRLNTLLAQSLYGQKAVVHYDTAEALLENVDSVNPSLLDPHLRAARLGTLGGISYQRKQYDRAIAHYEQAQAVDGASVSYAASIRAAKAQRAMVQLQEGARRRVPTLRRPARYRRLADHLHTD